MAAPSMPWRARPGERSRLTSRAPGSGAGGLSGGGPLDAVAGEPAVALAHDVLRPSERLGAHSGRPLLRHAGDQPGLVLVRAGRLPGADPPLVGAARDLAVLAHHRDDAAIERAAVGEERLVVLAPHHPRLPEHRQAQRALEAVRVVRRQIGLLADLELDAGDLREPLRNGDVDAPFPTLDVRPDADARR